MSVVAGIDPAVVSFVGSVIDLPAMADLGRDLFGILSQHASLPALFILRIAVGLVALVDSLYCSRLLFWCSEPNRSACS